MVIPKHKLFDFVFFSVLIIFGIFLGFATVHATLGSSNPIQAMDVIIMIGEAVAIYAVFIWCLDKCGLFS